MMHKRAIPQTHSDLFTLPVIQSIQSVLYKQRGIYWELEKWQRRNSVGCFLIMLTKVFSVQAAYTLLSVH